MDSRSNQVPTNANYGDFAGNTHGTGEPQQQQQGFPSNSFDQQQNVSGTQPNVDSPHHHLHNDNEPIGQKQYDPNAAAAFSQPNVDELSSNQTTSYRPDVDFDQDQERTAEGTNTGDEHPEQQQKTGGIGARISGKAQEVTGKFTKNPLKEAAGLEKQSTATKDAGKADALEQRADDVRARAAGGAQM